MKLNEILQEALNADRDERKVLHEFYLKSLNEILEAKSILEKKEAEIRDKINKYSEEVISIDPKTLFREPTGNLMFPFNGTWAEKIDFILGRRSNLTAREIADEIESIQPELKGRTISSVSPTLSDHVREDKKYIKTVDENLKVNRFSLKAK